MSEESDEGVSDLEIESRTWKKLERDMKVLGFQEGASKGRDIALQQGFNSGYLDGFNLGEHLGLAKGIISCQRELGIPMENVQFNEKDIESLSSRACVLCPEDKSHKTPINEKFYDEVFESIISKQQDHNNEIIKNLENAKFEIKPE